MQHAPDSPPAASAAPVPSTRTAAVLVPAAPPAEADLQEQPTAKLLNAWQEVERRKTQIEAENKRRQKASRGRANARALANWVDNSCWQRLWPPAALKYSQKSSASNSSRYVQLMLAGR